ncbi:class I SAM-dependent methyltransferase [Cuneatibacter sp. NSJ-177]|uniref:class I SAM-dependent methyltransferase n=1 Tax=Cuneatibacter sp. NSJ-177 TaxID=2931401 RepID=UPI001FD0E4C9|nr:class I SAM-dependent methyltransferase [Cuneatibacter sp. NSJ-177]MCJ7836336.1 class I SAM-dependent methyltransferase [Cuneatibacter sp. NSJ-177]
MEARKSLLEVFRDRPARFRLLQKGLDQIPMEEIHRIVELGCAYGDASAYLAERYPCQVTGLDLSEELLAQARRTHGAKTGKGELRFCQGDSQNLPAALAPADLLVSEAAFSLLPDKEAAVKSAYRVCKEGGRVILNDFAIRLKAQPDERKRVDFIPCFAGVGQAEEYQELFEQNGFRTVCLKEVYGELISISVWLSKSYGIPVTEIGSCLVEFFSPEGACPCKNRNGDFFKNAKLTYVQMIFQKRAGN